MYLIALCDDEAAELEKTEKLLSGYEKEHPGTGFLIRCFESADELIHLVQEERYKPDLIFMDIYMSDTLGTEAAKKLRSMNYKGEIVFLTTSREHALEAFDVEALQYIVKPVEEAKLFSILDILLKDIVEERKKYILLKVEGNTVRLSLNDILYCEAQGKIQCLHLLDGSRHVLRMTMTEIYGILSNYQEFVRLGVSYIVNLGHIRSLSAKEICMDNGMKLYLPRGTYKTLKEQYFQYYCEEE
ncbi:MAG: LytTR family DNA-binding domain-containing protein [Blautia sp.]|nr:LytTR family DNA-binding domain-containing protein [Blautia sp.]